MNTQKPIGSVDAWREWRERHGITQRDVSRECDTGERTVARWEHGRGEPSLTQVAVLEARWPGLLAQLMPAVIRRYKAAKR